MGSTAVLTFHTQSAAIRAERVLAHAGIAVRLIPTPRQISSDCGIAARIDAGAAEQAVQVLGGKGVEVAGVHVV